MASSRTQANASRSVRLHRHRYHDAQATWRPTRARSSALRARLAITSHAQAWASAVGVKRARALREELRATRRATARSAAWATLRCCRRAPPPSAFCVRCACVRAPGACVAARGLPKCTTASKCMRNGTQWCVMTFIRCINVRRETISHLVLSCYQADHSSVWPTRDRCCRVQIMLPGVSCPEHNTSLATVEVKPAYWRLTPHSTQVSA